MTPSPEKMTGLTDEEREARKALRCLFIAVESTVASDVEAKVLAGSGSV